MAKKSPKKQSVKIKLKVGGQINKAISKPKRPSSSKKAKK